ncbi:hypothetical protein [Paraburkholderia sp. J8-2]|uniref:hypothetical protein n=1 Tax=Paraburkholderia sp. J8-2 TaxID=2805440 RepID=UPI002AB65BBB|nr:hypothetical protein [Paraburkholderia sp. J8-2]
MADAFTNALHDYFASALGPVLADQQVGLHYVMFPEVLGEFLDSNGGFQKTLADETFSRRIADRAGQLVNGLRLGRSDSLADIIDAAVLDRATFYERQDQAKALVEKSRTAFNSHLAEAKRSMENWLVGIDGHKYQGSNATPADWLNPNGPASIWSKVKLVAQTKSEAEPALSLRRIDPDALRKKLALSPGLAKWPPPNLSDLLHRPGWIDPAPPVITSPAVDKHWTDLTGYLGGPAFNTAALAQQVRALRTLALATPLSDMVEGLPVVATTPATTVALREVVLPDTVTTDPIGQDHVDVSFEYTVVKIDRPWLYTPFLIDMNWYIPDARRGELNPGIDGASGALLAQIPIQFIVVRNVVMSAQFNEADASAINSSFAIGPLGTAGKVDIQDGSLTLAGMQIIAYIDISVATLPPRSAPSFIV